MFETAGDRWLMYILGAILLIGAYFVITVNVGGVYCGNEGENLNRPTKYDGPFYDKHCYVQSTDGQWIRTENYRVID